MVKTRVVIDGQVHSMRVHKNDLHKSGYSRTERRKTKIKKEMQTEPVIPDFSIIQSPYPSTSVRSYVTQVLSIELDQVVTELLLKLKELYARFKDDKGKRKSHKRFVAGLKEAISACDKGYRLDRTLLSLFVAPDIENTSNELQCQIDLLLTKCSAANVPVIFCLNRKLLGKTIKNGAVKLAVVGVLNVSGAEQLHQTVVELSASHKLDYQAIIESFS